MLLLVQSKDLNQHGHDRTEAVPLVSAQACQFMIGRYDCKGEGTNGDEHGSNT